MTMQIRPLLLFVSLVFTFSLGATLVTGSEKAVTTPVVDVAAFSQTRPHIATNGDSYLAVWIDEDTTALDDDVHGALITADGKRFGDDVLRIATTSASEPQADVEFGRDRYLVVWVRGNVLFARFVAGDGSMSDVFDVGSMHPDMGSTQPQIAFTGNRFLVTWFDLETYRGSLIDLNGAVLNTFEIAPRQQTFLEAPTVAANGTFYFISSITDFSGVPNGNGYPGDVGVTPIDRDGNVGTRTVIAPPTTPVFDLRAASQESDFAIAWSTAIGISGGTVRAVRVTPAGAGAIETIPAEGKYLHALGADEAGFFVIYGADETKFLRRLGTATEFEIATPAVKTTVPDATGSIAIVRAIPPVGFDWGPAGADLYISHLVSGEIEPLAVAPRHQQQPDIAAAGDLRLVVWSEYIGSERRVGIVGARLDANGFSLDPEGIDLLGSVIHPIGPRVASNGTNWLVTWVDGTSVYAMRVARNGNLLDAVPMLVAAGVYGGSDVAVSWDGTQYVVIYLRGFFQRGLRTTVRAARVPAQGAITAPELTLSEELANEFPSIASGPQGSLVIWRSGISLDGALLSQGGTITPVAFPAGSITPRPSVAWNNGTFLVAAPFGGQLRWQLVSATGVVTTSTSLPGSVTDVHAEAYGDGFLVYWKGNPGDTIFAARISSTGMLLDGAKSVGTTLQSYAPSFGAAGNTIVYARPLGRENARVYARDVSSVNGNPRRRSVR